MENSNATGRQLKDMKLKPNTLLAFINRSGKIIIPTGIDSIEVGDSVMGIFARRDRCPDGGCQDCGDHLGADIRREQAYRPFLGIVDDYSDSMSKGTLL